MKNREIQIRTEEGVRFREERHLYVSVLFMFSHCGQSLAGVAEAESSPQKGLTWDRVKVVGLKGRAPDEKQLVALWKSNPCQRPLFEDFHDHKPLG